MASDSTIPDGTERVFFAWDCRYSSIRSFLSKHCTGEDGCRYDTLMTRPIGGAITTLVFQKIARATAFVALLGTKPNVNVGFELGLALGLGKKVLAACWGTDDPYGWVDGTPPFPGFITPGVTTPKILLKKLNLAEVWQPSAELARSLAAPLPTIPEAFHPGRSGTPPSPSWAAPLRTIPKAFHLCPAGGIWESCLEEFGTRSERYASSHANTFSLTELATTFPDIGRLVWVMVPEEDGGPIHTPKNTGNAVVAGWFLGRCLGAGQDVWANDEQELNRRMTAATTTVFHPVVIGVKPLADLQNKCKPIRDATALGAYLDELIPRPSGSPPPPPIPLPVPLPPPAPAGDPDASPSAGKLAVLPPTYVYSPAADAWERSSPQLIIPDPEVRGGPGVEPEALHILVKGLLNLSRNRASGPKTLRDRLDLTDDQYHQILNRPTGPHGFKIDPDRLFRVCDEDKVFPHRTAFEQFLATPPGADGDGLVRVEGLVRTDSAAGRAVIRVVQQHIFQRTEPTRWKDVIGDERKILEDPSASATQKELALKRVYLKAGVLHGPTDNDDFTVYGFDQDTWQTVVGRSQEAAGEGVSHLYYANETMRYALRKWFGKRTDLAREKRAGKPIVVRVVEGGVGGCNTTHSVFQGIEDGLRDAGADPALVTFEYQGFELNPRFADAATRILTGEVVPAGNDTIRSDDPRVVYFRKLREGKRLESFGQDVPLVKCTDMFDGMRALGPSVNVQPASIDLFVCSYAFHHVPNGLRLADYLFSPADPYLPRFAGERQRYRERFRDEVLKQLQDWWDFSRDETRLLPLTRVFLHSLGPLGVLGRKAVFEAVHKIRPDRTEPLPDGVIRPLIEDQQHGMVIRAHHFLKPGGMVAVADPDGFSVFNQTQVPINPEMAVAHFRYRTEMGRLLKKDHRFVILEDWNLLCVREVGGKREYTRTTDTLDELSVSISARLPDNNLGYVILAQKPS